jgi:Cu2+-exporting ATPase/Cu+-exporting ATPase
MKKILSIEGMSCKNCVHHVETALKELPAVEIVSVDLKKGLANITLNREVSNDTLINTIDEVGYKVTKIEG